MHLQLSYDAWTDLAANTASKSVSLSPEVIALIGFCIPAIYGRELWANVGEPLTDAEWDTLREALDDFVGVMNE